VPRNDRETQGPLFTVIASYFASRFCSCLIHQAQSPNKLGNYIFKLCFAMTEGGVVASRRRGNLGPPLLSLRAKRGNPGESQKSKIKMQNDRAKMKKQSVISSQRLAND
jgi:hypothetical protein